jgi:hypothetical protein
MTSSRFSEDTDIRKVAMIISDSNREGSVWETLIKIWKLQADISRFVP